MSSVEDEKLTRLLAEGKALLKQFLESTPDARRGLQKPLLALIDRVTKEAQAYFRKEQLQEAHRVYVFMQELGEQLTLGNIEAKGWAGMGRVFLKMGRLDEAIDNLLMSLSLVQGLGYKDEERSTAYAIGLTFQAKGNYAEAVKYFQQCLGIDRELGNREGEGLLLGRMGECYSQMGQYNKALDSLQFSLKIARETGNREREEELIALIREVNKAMAQR